MPDKGLARHNDIWTASALLGRHPDNSSTTSSCLPMLCNDAQIRVLNLSSKTFSRHAIGQFEVTETVENRADKSSGV